MTSLFSQIYSPGKTTFGTSDDFLFLKQPDGCFAVGKGPFSLHTGPSLDTPSFYLNDFSHRFSRPWIRPRRFYQTNSIIDLVNQPRHAPTSPLITWQPPSREIFQRAFETVCHYLRDGAVNKLVPAVVEEGRVMAGKAEHLLRELESTTWPSYPYGIRIGDAGMIGASPEPIVSIEGDRLSTIALAGTAASEVAHETLLQDKERREHLYVADFIASRLQAYGKTSRSSVNQLDLGSVKHLMTGFETLLKSKPDITQLIDTLHPTPAVGPSPRNAQTMQLALALRNMAGVPPTFAVPFGVACGNDFHALLTIRNIHWQGSRLLLAAGGGIVRGSKANEEWEELRLKRESVKTFFGLGFRSMGLRALSA